ncbi:unnamed protein product [Fraxinus pennsylvanica]|uniref:Uncharacterized protein n=1 Tax=Fraxinus pennsylvanica TaxID=56036 RepID=A0AAD2A962_9LAMI|nr:unnamed protein product [Fraxinus pennsylvanica]
MSALAQVIRFHPKLPRVWIHAAAWEFDHNLNVTAARALMQSGLRACPTSEDLWVEYLRMELTYLNKLKARKVVLRGDSTILAQDRQKPHKQNTINTSALVTDKQPPFKMEYNQGKMSKSRHSDKILKSIENTRFQFDESFQSDESPTQSARR